MNNEEKIISFLRENGLDVSKYVDTFRHVIPGTVCLLTRSMWGYGGHYADWQKLTDILDSPGCPIRMESVSPAPNERPRSFDRLIWKDSQPEV